MSQFFGWLAGLAVVFSNTNYEGQRDFEDYESNIVRYTTYIQNLNRGATKSLQSNPNDTTTDCYTSTTETNALIDYMMTETNYVDNEISQSEFQENFQIMAFALMDEFENCGVNEFLIVLDGALNNIPQTTSALTSAATQLALGYENQDTSLYIGIADIQTAFANDDMEGVGEGLGLLVSQILKYEAPGAVIQVQPTNA